MPCRASIVGRLMPSAASARPLHRCRLFWPYAIFGHPKPPAINGLRDIVHRASYFSTEKHTPCHKLSY